MLLRPADDELLNTAPWFPVTLVLPTQPPTGRANTTPLIDLLMQLAHLSTPRASNWVVTTLLTEQSSRDLSTQLAFEQDTSLPCAPRPWCVHLNFGECLMGLDENWTKLGATPRLRRGRPPKIKRGGARHHSR